MGLKKYAYGASDVWHVKSMDNIIRTVVDLRFLCYIDMRYRCI